MKQSAPLSKSQLGVYAECVQHENEVFYNLPFLYVFDGSIDADRLCRAIEATVQAHPVFFTRIELSDEGEPMQTIDLEKEEFSLSVEQVTDLETEKREFIQPFKLYGGRLFHTKVMRDADHVYWLFDMHHIISDGSSYHIIVCDVETAYNGGTLAPEEMSMQEFALAEAEMRKTPAFEEGKQWYAQNFDCGDTFTQLMPDLEIPEQTDGQKFRVLGTDMDRVDAFCKTNGIKKSTFFTSAYSFLLAKYNNEQESLFTTVFNGRTEPKFQHSVGMTVKTLPVYAKFTDDTTVLDFMKAGEEQMIGCRKHNLYSYTDIMTDLNLQTNSIFAWHGLILDFTELMGKPMQAIQLRKHNEGVSFYLMAFYVGKKYHIKAEYNANEYSETLIDQFLESYEAVLEGFLSQTLLRDIDICTESQRALLDSFNQTDTELDENATIVSKFREQVAKTPDNITVVYQDKRFTYKELDAISDRIAAYIHGKGLHEEDVVSVLIPRCEWMPIVSMGVLKAGCAYQPLDPTYPSERLNFMMQDASVKLLIADESLRDIVNEYQGDVLFTKDIATLEAVDTLHETSLPTPSSLFIMLYTSSTTGTPKGCQIVHRNIVAFCEWYHRRFNLTPGCKVTAYASFGFDANMMETYPCLTAGATLYIIPEELRLDLLALNEYFEKEQITHGFMTTQVAYQFATSVENHCLRYLLTGGEKLAPLTPPTNYTLVNLYGPTESTVCITSFDVTKPMKDIPIGAALDNVKLYIVDKAGHRLPVGVAGELWVAGPQVTRGYLNRPEKTAEVYIDNPFDSNEKYAHIYRTGDIVRYLPDGNIQFVGRKDGQVKIRGFRIELKEVEGVILQFPGIKDATVQAFDEEGGGKFIAAYIVSDDQIDIESLNNFIMEEKPPYMVPAVTMQIERIPLNQNQKVNRKALPAPVIQAADHEYVEPANDTERLFCKIFSDILSVDKIGATDNFFELGGTSLMVTRVIIEADKNGHHIAYGDVFTNPTPRLLSNFLTGGAVDEDEEASNYDYAPINRVLESNTLDTFKIGELQSIGNVLLTGATGYLGIHVLKELIDRDDVPVIWCMVRGENDEKAERRLKGLLFYYFSNSYKELFGSRLRIVNGDVTHEINVDGKVDTVFNCAAVVKHFSKGTEIEDVNVGGAVNCVNFCLQNGVKLIHVSTYSTGGLSINGMPAEDTVFTERKLYFGQNLANQYVHSKFISERIVLEAVALNNLNAKVMRVGNLAPRSTDGEFQINFQTNSAMGRIRVFQMLGCYPYEMTDTPMEFSPINETAKAIVMLSQTPKECCLFHPYNNHSVHFGDVLAELSQVGKTPIRVEAEDFNMALELAKQNPEKAKKLSSLLAYQDMAHGQKAVFIIPDNQYTAQVLYRLGFHWSSTSWDYVDQMLVTIAGFGYFE